VHRASDNRILSPPNSGAKKKAREGGRSLSYYLQAKTIASVGARLGADQPGAPSRMAPPASS
jgi:hypothetical protein